MELLDLILGYECNYACDYCTLTSELRKNNMSTEQARGHLDDAAQRGVRRVAFGGGEPTIRADLIPLIEYARDCGFIWVKIHTNCARLAYENYLMRLLHAGVDEFHVTVSGADEKTRDRITRVPGADAWGIQAIRRLVDWGQEIVVTPIVMEDTYRTMPETLARYSDLGVRRFHMELVMLKDGNAKNVRSLPQISDVFPCLRRCFDWGQKNDIEVLIHGVPTNLLPGYENHALDPGDVTCVTPGGTFRLGDMLPPANNLNSHGN